MRKVLFMATAVVWSVIPAFAEDAPIAPAPDPRIAALEAQVKALKDDQVRANAIINALQRQRNVAMDQEVIAEAQKAVAPAPAPAPPAAPAKE